MTISMDEKLEEKFEEAKAESKTSIEKIRLEFAKNPKLKYYLIGAILVILIAFVFKNGFTIAVVLLEIFIALYVFTKLSYGKPSLKENLRKRRELLFEIDGIEKKYMKRLIDEKIFHDLYERKQNELIEIESEIDIVSPKGQINMNLEQFEDISLKKRHLLKELFEQKQKMLIQNGIAEKKYFKRQIDEETFRKISSECQAKIAKIEAQIKNIYSEEGIEKVMKELKEKLNKIETDIQNQEQKNEEEMSETLADSMQ